MDDEGYEDVTDVLKEMAVAFWKKHPEYFHINSDLTLTKEHREEFKRTVQIRFRYEDFLKLLDVEEI